MSAGQLDADTVWCTVANTVFRSLPACASVLVSPPHTHTHTLSAGNPEPSVEFMYTVFTRTPGESYCRRFDQPSVVVSLVCRAPSIPFIDSRALEDFLSLSWRGSEFGLACFAYCKELFLCFCLYGPFNCISFHKFSKQLSAFSPCSSGLISAVLVLSTTYLFMKVSFSPDVFDWAQNTN